MADRSPHDALQDADAKMQGVQQMAYATLEAVRAMLTQPDSINMRMGVLDLVENLAGQAFEAMNDINLAAERCGVDFSNDRRHAIHGAVCKVVRREGGGAA